MSKKRIGVFVCHCGINIAGVVDVGKVAEEAGKEEGVVYATDYLYMCSDPGQDTIRKTIEEQKLDSVVMACCSPTLHETTFRKAVASVGMNRFQCEIANIREQCSWVHAKEPEAATKKAVDTTRIIIKKAQGDEDLEDIKVNICRKAVVIGGGVAGIQSALDIARSGYPVTLVERSFSLGGHLAQLHETFPHHENANFLIRPLLAEVQRHPRIKILLGAEVDEVGGYIGNFDVKIKKRPTYTKAVKGAAWDKAIEACPVEVPSEFDRGMGKRKAIYNPGPHMIGAPVIDPGCCKKLKGEECDACVKAVGAEVEGAIDFEAGEELVEDKVGAFVFATGYDLYDKADVAEYGYGKIPDVIDSLQLERLLSPTGPTKGKLVRPSDGKVPKEVVFIQCVRSRDQERGVPYCSKICCMYTAKHARLFSEKVPDGQAYVFYMDIRAAGKSYEEFVKDAIAKDNVMYLRGRVSKVFQAGDKVVVYGADTLSGKNVEIEADLVVLAMAMVPNESAVQLARKLKVATDPHGFINEAHPKLRPVECATGGFFLAGSCQAPKDLPETIAQASGAAAKVAGIFAGDYLTHEPIIVQVDTEICSGCGACVLACPYSARVMDPGTGKAKIVPVLCHGCGSCSVACPNGATQQRNFSCKQYIQMVNTVT